MYEMTDVNELIELWRRTIGPPPESQQFVIWLEMHGTTVVKQGLLKTASKNQQVGRMMTSDHLVRFASKVMLTKSETDVRNAANREKIRREFDGRMVAESNPAGGDCA